MLRLLVFLVLFSFPAFSQDIPHWDVQKLSQAIKKDGNSFTVKENWVTTYLKNGGKIENVTGLKKEKIPLTAVFDDLVPMETLPAKFNWNELYRLQPIRNQKSCGSCWSFSITAVVESLMRIYYPLLPDPDYAEQTMVSSCCTSCGSCSGGYFSALDYVQNTGLPWENDDPYQARNSSCKTLTQKIKVEKWAYIGANGRNPTTEQIKSAVYQYGPVSVDVNGSFSGYSEGVYDRCGSTNTNHMVNIEGWDDVGQYWIVRNSWGSSWGEQGYFRIKWKSSNGRNCNGIGQVAVYVVIAAPGT